MVFVYYYSMVGVKTPIGFTPWEPELDDLWEYIDRLPKLLRKMEYWMLENDFEDEAVIIRVNTTAEELFNDVQAVLEFDSIDNQNMSDEILCKLMESKQMGPRLKSSINSEPE